MSDGPLITPDELAADLDRCMRISSDLGRHAAWIEEYFDLGFEAVYLHHTGRDQARFIEAFGDRVLPALGAAGR